MKIGLLIIATGKYISFVEQFRDSVEKYFFRDSPAKVTIFVFTDSSTVPDRTTRRYKEHKKFPYPTLTRYHTFYKYRKELSQMDYLFYCDVDMKFVSPVGKEILSEVTATLHPGFYDKSPNQFSYERRKKSTAFVAKNEGEHYFCGGFNGGSTRKFLAMSRTISRNIDRDHKKNIVAVWHDESHLNRYLIDHPPKKILSPSYCYPEGLSLPFPPKLIALSKNHEVMRFTGLEIAYRGLIQWLSRPIARIKDKLGTTSHLLCGLRFVLMRDFPQLWTWKIYTYRFDSVEHINCNIQEIKDKNAIDLVAVSFNNPGVIETQIRLLKTNLIDRYNYTVADNSSDSAKQAEIKKICSKYRVGYIRLPTNVFNDLNLGNLSHGSALTWVYNQYICQRKPRYFGFLDHDIFPIRKTSLVKYFHKSPVFGIVQPRDGCWYLWAGFCFYDMKYINFRHLDFLSKRYKNQRMDTGGGNWETLYSKLNARDLPVFPHHYLNLTGGKVAQHDMVEYFGDWLHLFNASNWYKMGAELFAKRQQKIDSLLKRYDH